MLNRHLLPAAGAISLQRLHLLRVGPRQLVEGRRRAVLRGKARFRRTRSPTAMPSSAKSLSDSSAGTSKSTRPASSLEAR
jgi:hypothetical protein